MAQRVGSHVFANSSTLPCPPTGILEDAGTDVTTRFLARGPAVGRVVKAADLCGSTRPLAANVAVYF
jgi:hypothetical protein